MNQNNQNNQNNRKPNYDYYAKYKKYLDGLYAQEERCPAICPYDQTQCILTAGHWGKHKCSQGHEWF